MEIVMKKVKVISCMITVGIMALIFFFSSQTQEESARTSGRLIMWFLNCVSVFSPISEGDMPVLVEALTHVVRKCAHFTIYAALGISASVSFRLLTGRRYKTVFPISTVFCILYAISDEIHQCFSYGRGPQATDVLIDTAGAITGFLLLMAVLEMKKIFGKGSG